MVLVFDIGNTNIVIGVFVNGEIVQKFRMITDKTLNSEQYFQKLINVLSDVDIEKIENCAICSVVPTVFQIFNEAVIKLLGREPFVVTYMAKMEVNLMVDNPEKLGNDLIANSVAAVSEFKLPVIIIDMGTATTFSIIDKNKNYLGGLIIPGVKISADALTERAQQLPEISIDKPKGLIGKNTIDCMQSGLVYGNAALIDDVIQRLETELGERAVTIITGGLSNIILPFCKKDIIYCEDLLLRGIYLIFVKNT